jgi:hypothetical protein
MYKSEPPGAIISGDAHGGGSFSYYTPMKLSYPGLTNGFREGACPEVLSPSVRWPDGVSLPAIRLRICYRDGEYTFTKPAPTYQAPAYQPPPSATVGINDAKKKCADLGFKSGTETFGNCVLKLSK